MSSARKLRRSPQRTFGRTGSPDPGRDMVMAAAEAGYMTRQQAEELDAWAGALADEVCAGTLTEEECDRRIAQRLLRDLARRGSA